MPRCRRVVGAGVRDAEPPARSEDGRLVAEVAGQPGHQVEHDLHRRRVAAQVQDLRAQVRVQADQLHPVVRQRLLDGRSCGPGLDREAELGVELAGGDEVVGVGLDAGREPELRLHPPAGRRHPAEQFELVGAVDDDRASGIDRQRQLRL